MALTNSLCAMLRSTPFHKENYARLILQVIIQFYQRCSDRFHDLVSPEAAPAGATAAEDQVALAFQFLESLCPRDLVKVPGI